MATRDATPHRFPDSLSPRERSALRRRWRPVIPLALAVLSLVSLVVVLLTVEHRTRESLDEFSDVVDPARAAVTTIELTLALESSDVAGFLLTGDPRFAASHVDERALRLQAQERLLALAPILGDGIGRPARTLVDHLSAADRTLDSLYDGGLSRTSYTARLDQEQARFASIIGEAGRLETALLRTSADRRQEFIQAQRWAATVSTILIVGACVALALLARLGAGFQTRAIRLDAREQQQSELRETSRALNASVSTAEAARILADGALAGTSAVGVLLELARDDSTECEMTTGVALRGVAPRSANVMHEHSLTTLVARSGDAPVAVSADTLLERMDAPPSMRAGDLHGTILPVVSDQRVRGVLALVRPGSAPTSQTEDSYLGALTELAASVSKRVELVSQLRASEERFRQLADNIRGFVWLRDPATVRFLYANPAYEEIWGRSRESLYRDGTSWLEGVHPDDRQRVLAVLPPAKPAPYELEYRVVQPNGSVRWVWSRGFPVRNEHGEIYRMAGVTEDITDRKLNELSRERLIERERAAREASEAAQATAERRRKELEQVTESRTRLMRGFTHDVKNPLGAADGFLALLEEGVFGEITDKQRDSIGRARGSIGRALELITGVLELARADAAKLELQHVDVDVRDTIKEVASEFHAQAEAKEQDMSTELASDVPTIASDPSRIRQIVGNLVSNAIKYTPPHGQITVSVAPADGRAPAAGEWVVVDVTDTGPGIPADQFQNLFSEFTRLNPEAADGAGLGLAISQRLARALGGRVTVESREGEGSRFSLWLPKDGSA